VEHYAQVTEADLQEAARMSLLDDTPSLAQNAAQYPAAVNGKGQKATSEQDSENADLPLVTAGYSSVHE